MEKREATTYAGNLIEELSEIGKTEQDSKSVELQASHTLGCGTFLTIYCC